MLVLSCEEQISEDVIILQEDVVYISAEQLVLTGRIVSQTNIDASDHGFIIAEVLVHKMCRADL